MSTVIWHNPKCSTSKKVLEMIRARGIEPTIVDYQQTPPSAAEIKAALAAMNMKPRDLLRRKNTPYDELKLDNPKLTVGVGHHRTNLLDQCRTAGLNGHPRQYAARTVPDSSGDIASRCLSPQRGRHEQDTRDE